MLGLKEGARRPGNSARTQTRNCVSLLPVPVFPVPVSTTGWAWHYKKTQHSNTPSPHQLPTAYSASSSTANIPFHPQLLASHPVVRPPPMYSPSCNAPRPILKSSSRKSSTSSTSSCSSASPSPPPTPSSSRGPCVQFSQCLSTTYLAYSSVDYNRSPITVTPNTCALPSRGRCTGSASHATSSAEEGAALRQFRLEAEGRPVPALIHDDGDSSSEESGTFLSSSCDQSHVLDADPLAFSSSVVLLDVSIPNPKTYTQQYTIPASLLKSRRTSSSRPSSRPSSQPSPYPSCAPAYSIPEHSEAYGADRDDIFGGF